MTRSTPTSSASDTGALLPAIVLFGGIALVLIALFAARPGVTPTAVAPVEEQQAAAPTGLPTAAVAAPQQVGLLDPLLVTKGNNAFQSICSACHGFNAQGIPGLGKSMIGSEFINSQTDADLVAFIIKGRDISDPLNTTGVMMPPRGGNPALSDEDLLNIVYFIRSLNGVEVAQAAPVTAAPTVETTPFQGLNLSGLAAPTSIAAATTAPVEPTAVPVEPTAAPTIQATIAPVEPTTAPVESSSLAVPGQDLYVQACAVCHADNGKGIPGVAKPLSESVLLQNRDGIGLLTFLSSEVLLEGMLVPHPARGGFLNLSDQDLNQIIIYMYSLPM
ncbi:MAG: c-type cytochrome [Anaerolineae bacterium]|nr:c-type cytochrome [Anaerolineae bacterium]